MPVEIKHGDPIVSTPEDFRLLAAAKALVEYDGPGSVPLSFATLLLELKDAVNARAAQSMVGPTGEYPNGKLQADDDGELSIAVKAEDRMVKVVFGTPTTWLAMPPGQARELAAVLSTSASLAEQAAVADDTLPPA